MNITIIGGGNMARALLGGLIARGHGSHALTVVEIDPEARATVSARFGVATFAALEPPAVVNADVIVIAVKPHNVRSVALEEALDAVTAVSGSGPAYVFYFLEALDAAAREVGFTPAEARRLALATFAGAIRLAEQSAS